MSVEKALKELSERLALAMRQFCDVVMLQEKRIRALEELHSGEEALRIELRELHQKIEAIPDADQRTKAADAFTHICQLLRIENLEE